MHSDLKTRNHNINQKAAQLFLLIQDRKPCMPCKSWAPTTWKSKAVTWCAQPSQHAKQNRRRFSIIYPVSLTPYSILLLAVPHDHQNEHIYLAYSWNALSAVGTSRTPTPLKIQPVCAVSSSSKISSKLHCIAHHGKQQRVVSVIIYW